MFFHPPSRPGALCACGIVSAASAVVFLPSRDARARIRLPLAADFG
jgi:hypothetical protein